MVIKNSVLERVRRLISKDEVHGRLTVRVHDVRADYPNLNAVHGIDLYCYRALMMRGGVTLVLGEETPDLKLWRDDLHAVGIGPSEVVWVSPVRPGAGLYQSVLEDPTACEVIYEVLKAGGQLQVFHTSHAAVEMLTTLASRLAEIATGRGEEFQFDETRHFASAGPLHASRWNSKRWCRERARERGYANLYPRFELYSSIGRVCAAARSFAKEGDYVVKFAHAAASTEGMVFLPRGEVITRAEVSSRWDTRNGVIIDRFERHLPFSLVFHVSGTGARLLHASIQKLRGIASGRLVDISDMRDPDRGAHQGNYVGVYGQDLGPLSWATVEYAVQFLEPVLRDLFESGYRGVINADLGLLPDGSVLLFEFNARVSHSQFTAAVQEAVRPAFPRQQVVVFAGNVEDVGEDLASYGDAASALVEEGVLYDGTGGPGVQIYHAPLLGLGIRKCGMLVIAPTFAGVQELENRAVHALQQRQLQLVQA